MTDYDVGRGLLQVVPSFRGVADAIDREAAKWGLSSGQAYARAFNDEVRRATNNAPLGPSDPDSARQGERSAGKFADGFKAKVTAALRALPDVQINANSTDADRKLADLRAQLVALSNARVGVDIDEGAALAQIDRLKAELDQLAARSPSVSVRMDTAEAAAQLAALRAEIDGVNRSAKDLGSTRASPNVSIDSGPALAAIAAIKTALLTLSAGAVITPLIGGAAALLGPLAAVGLGGAGVVGASLPGLDAVKNALSAQSAAQKSATSTATSSAAAQVAAANQIKSAQLSLADTERRVANDQITSAQQVATAEQGLQQAQRASLAAQQALTDAREAGARSLEDSANSVKDAQLSLAADRLAVTQAQQTLDSVNASSTSTDLQKQQAALALQQAQQSLVEQQLTLSRATEDNNKTQAAGVNGSKQVVAAQQQITSTSQQVKAAEQALANARRQQADQAAQDASELTRAHMAVAQAQESASRAADAGSASTNTLAAAMGKLTPQERELLAATTRFKAAFKDFGHDLEPVTLPLFTGGLGLLGDLLPKLEPLIRATAGGLAEMEKSVSRAVNGPGFGKFLDTLTKLVGPALHDIAGIGGNLAGVFAHVVEAFAPLSGVVLGGLKTLTGELNKASTSPALSQFVQLLVKLGPQIVSTFGSVGGAVGSIVKALAPLAGPVLSVIKTIADAVSGIVTAVGPTVSHLFATLAPAINSLITTLAPVITSVVKTLGPVLETLGVSFVKALVALSPAIEPIARLIGTVVDALSPLLPVIGQLIGTLLPPLAQLFTELWQAAEPFIRAVVAALQPVLPQIAEAFGELVKALSPVFPLFDQVLTSLVPLIPSLADLIVQIIKLAVDLLPLLIPLLQLMASIISEVLVPVLKFLITAITDVVKVVRDVIDWFKHLGSTFQAVGHDIASVWSSTIGAIKTAWRDVRDFLSKEWKAFAGTASKLWDSIAGGIGKAFSAVRTTVGSIWTDVEKVFAGGVNFVTQDILNPLITILNDVLGVFGVHIGKIGKITVPSSSKPAEAPGGTFGGSKAFALGGVLPGYSPGVDNVLIPQFHFSGGEGILVPEATRALGGPDGIQAINSMFSARVSPPNHFAGGGTTPLTPKQQEDLARLHSVFDPSLGGGVVAGVLSAINDIKDAIRRGAADVAIAALKTAEAPIKAVLGTGGTPFASKLAAGVFNKLNDSVYDFIRGHVKKIAAAAGGTIPTGDHLALIRQALGLAGVTDSPGNEAAVNTIVSYESGWNPNAINLTDANAAAGHPSQGLAQTIPGTFEAYRLRSLPDVITDPLANLVAGIRYAVSTYGSLQNVPGVVGVANGTGYVGYDNGGFLPPGLSTVYNATGRPEPVLTSAQWAQLKDLSSRTADGLHIVINPSAAMDEVAIGTAAARRIQMMARI